jgi:2-oxoglutarate ferredoxin oxidoreductase subunit alpha
MADSHRAVLPFAVEDLDPITVGADPAEVASPYRRYALTPDGLSPRLLPGASDHLVIADSDEHDEEGHITEDLTIRVQMVNKRMQKLDGLKREVLAPSYEGDAAPDLLLISWGSTQGSMLEAAARLRTNGRTVGTLHFAQVWPLAAEQFIHHLRGARQVVCIESNVTGQFARLVLRETGFMITRQVLRFDGLPITPEYILRELTA